MSLIWSDNAPSARRRSFDANTVSMIWSAVWPAFFAGLVLRAIFALMICADAPLYNDARDYYQEAVGIAAGTRGGAPFYWPPGTTFYLASCFYAFGASLPAARLAIVILGSLQTIVVARLGAELTGSIKVGRLSGWIWALYPPAMLLTFQPYSQHLSAFCLAAAALYGYRTLATFRWQPATLAGIFLGIGTLTRPSMTSIVMFFALAAAWRGVTLIRAADRRGALRLCLLTAWSGLLCLGTLAPVLEFNRQAGAGLTLSTNNQRNFFLGNNPYTPHYKTSHFAQHEMDEFPRDVQKYLRSHYTHPDARHAMMKSALDYMRAHPWITLARTANRARAFWGFDYLAALALRQTLQLSTPLFLAVLALEAGGYCLVILLALGGVITRFRSFNFGCAVWLLGLVVCYAAPYFIAFSAGTYHFPVMGLLIPFAAAACVEPDDRYSLSSVLRNRWCWLAVAAFALLQAEYAHFAIAYATGF